LCQSRGKEIILINLNDVKIGIMNFDLFCFIKISDLDNACPNPTTLSLMRCKKQILHPFRKLLCLVSHFIYKIMKIVLFAFLQIGWRPFGVDSLKRSSIFLRIINIIYPILILILLLFNYTYEIIICQGKLNVITDTQVCFHLLF
jgi:hypothetical protein